MAEVLNFSDFLALSFSHHMEILEKTDSVEERAFYIHQAVLNHWDKYLLDFINVEELGERNPQDIDERVVEKAIVQNVKNFILTFGKDFTYVGHQVHIEKFEHDMRVLNDDERKSTENPVIGIILCQNADKPFVEYLLQDYNQPMGVATYKAMPEKLKSVLPDEKLLLEAMRK